MHFGALTVMKRVTEALVNGGCNYSVSCSCKIRLYAGTSEYIRLLVIYHSENI